MGKSGLQRQLPALAVCLVLAAGCQAEPPSARGGPSQVTVSEGRYASIATCTAFCTGPAAQCIPACTGPQCAQELVTGMPDGRSMELGSTECQVLDVVFTGGAIAPRAAITDLIVHVDDLDPGVQVRVEASRRGVKYDLVAWINGAPTPTNDRCTARIEGTRVLLDLSAGQLNGGCNYVENVSHLRFSVAGNDLVGPRLGVDALEVEPCSFRPQGEATDPGCTNTIVNPIPDRDTPQNTATTTTSDLADRTTSGRQ